jgi:hypothetical protein
VRALVLFAVVFTSTAARADDVVTLPTLLQNIPDRGGAWQRAMDDYLEAGIRNAGRKPRLPGPLTGSELGCREPECMARVAEGSGGPAQVLGAKVIADRGSPPSYKIIVTRFDPERPNAVHQEAIECSVCTQAEVGDKLTQVVGTLLPKPAAPIVTATPAAAVTPTVVATPAHRTYSRKLLSAAIGTSAAFGAVGIAMLGIGGRAFAIDGQPTSIPSPAGPSPELYDTRGTGIGLTVVGGLMLVSTSVELGVEIWLLRHRAR